jgi:hypothetical protein
MNIKSVKGHRVPISTWTVTRYNQISFDPFIIKLKFNSSLLLEI